MKIFRLNYKSKLSFNNFNNATIKVLKIGELPIYLKLPTISSARTQRSNSSDDR